MKSKNIDELFEIEEIHKRQSKGEKKEENLYNFYIPYYHRFRIIINKIKNYLTLEGVV